MLAGPCQALDRLTRKNIPGLTQLYGVILRHTSLWGRGRHGLFPNSRGLPSGDSMAGGPGTGMTGRKCPLSYGVQQACGHPTQLILWGVQRGLEGISLSAKRDYRCTGGRGHEKVGVKPPPGEDMPPSPPKTGGRGHPPLFWGPVRMPPLLCSPRSAAQAAYTAGPRALPPAATCGPADAPAGSDLQDWSSSLRPLPALLGACLPGLLIAGKKPFLRV